MSSSNKIEQNKAQYHLDRQTTKISALSSGNVHKYDRQIWLTEKDLLEKIAVVKRFEYSALGKKLKAQTSAAVSQIRHSFWILWKGRKNEKKVVLGQIYSTVKIYVLQIPQY